MIDQVVETALRGGTLGAALLVWMDFREAPQWWWRGFGPLDVDGQEWRGMGDLISVSGLSRTRGESANKVTFSISAVTPEVVRNVVESEDRVIGRLCRCYMQFFDMSPENLTPYGAVGTPIALWTGRMSTPTFTMIENTQFGVSLPAENIWVTRSRPPLGTYTYNDQISRFPSDTCLKHVASMVDRVVVWPDF